jgi:bifunctional non-homologous end joining protein LigD
MYVTYAAGLVGAVQMGTLEFHIWGARRDRLDRPDRMVFDLDPDEGLPFAEVARAAADLRGILGELGLSSWPLVTGGKGVHVVVPLRRIAGWDTVRLFARVFAQGLEAAQPERFVAGMSKARRKGRIFIDWLRNDRGATTIAPLSLRARPGAPAAVPVSWEELSGLKAASAFDARAARERGWDGVGVPDPVGLGSARIAALERWVERKG